MSPNTARIFISYSHDSDSHRGAVLALANRLRHDGLDCMIDQYVNGFPPEGWQRWMENQIERADYVLVVCTPSYLKRYRGLENKAGLGVTFEGVIISQTLYDAHYRNTKFVPVLPEAGEFDHIPLPLKGFGAFRMDKDYEGLYRYLTGQAVVRVPEIGTPITLEPAHHPDHMPPPVSIKAPEEKKERTMSDTIKAGWLVGILTLIAAIIGGYFTSFGSPNKTINGDNGSIIEGNGDLPPETSLSLM